MRVLTRFPVASRTRRGSYFSQEFAASLSETRSVISARHSHRAPGSNCWHARQQCRALAHLGQVVSGPLAGTYYLLIYSDETSSDSSYLVSADIALVEPKIVGFQLDRGLVFFDGIVGQ